MPLINPINVKLNACHETSLKSLYCASFKSLLKNTHETLDFNDSNGLDLNFYLKIEQNF